MKKGTPSEEKITEDISEIIGGNLFTAILCLIGIPIFFVKVFHLSILFSIFLGLFSLLAAVVVVKTNSYPAFAVLVVVWALALMEAYKHDPSPLLVPRCFGIALLLVPGLILLVFVTGIIGGKIGLLIGKIVKFIRKR